MLVLTSRSLVHGQPLKTPERLLDLSKRLSRVPPPPPPLLHHHHHHLSPPRAFSSSSLQVADDFEALRSRLAPAGLLLPPPPPPSPLLSSCVLRRVCRHAPACPAGSWAAAQRRVGGGLDALALHVDPEPARGRDGAGAGAAREADPSRGWREHVGVRGPSWERAGGGDHVQASLQEMRVEEMQEFSREKHNLEEITPELVMAAQMVEAAGGEMGE
eukprot:759343-Hanusia_phi.AAC.2